MKILRLTHVETSDGNGASCIYAADQPQSLIEEINEMRYCEVGEKWIITVEEITAMKFRKLPEFIGW